MDEKLTNGNNFSLEKRMYKREKFEKIITYSTSLANHTFCYPADYKMLMLEGKAIDISYGGLGMITSIELKLDGLAFTEHYSYAASGHSEALKEKYRGMLRILRGVEYSSAEGHCLIF